MAFLAALGGAAGAAGGAAGAGAGAAGAGAASAGAAGAGAGAGAATGIAGDAAAATGTGAGMNLGAQGMGNMAMNAGGKLANRIASEPPKQMPSFASQAQPVPQGTGGKQVGVPMDASMFSGPAKADPREQLINKLLANYSR